MVEANAGSAGRLDGMAQHNVRMPEDRVDAQPPGLVTGHLAGHFVGCPSVHPWGAGVAGLVRRIIWDFRLIKIGAAAIAVPQHLELLLMLDEEPVSRDVVAVHHQAVLVGVQAPAYAGAVIGAPDPGMIDDGVVAVDLQVDSGASHAGPTHAEKEIVQRDWILSVTGVAALRTDLDQHGRTRGSGIDEKARENDAVLVGGDKGGVARA